MIPDRVAAALAALPRPVCAYVYDRAVLRERAAAVRAALPAGSLLLYAVKANGHPGVVATLSSTVDGLEVASGGELALALAAGAATVAFGGPAKTPAELAAAVAAGASCRVLVNAESPLELRRLSTVDASHPVTVLLRVNRSGVDAALEIVPVAVAERRPAPVLGEDRIVEWKPGPQLHDLPAVHTGRDLT